MLEIKKEELYFFIDISTSFLKKKILLKGIKEFIEKKKKINILSSFNLLLFNDDNSPVFISDKTSSKDITDPLSDNWDVRNKQSNLENGLFFALSEILNKAKKVFANYRIIVITDSPSDIPVELQEALFDLLDKVKIFPTFIDIIRTGENKFYSDDVKLKIISSDTSGGMFYADSVEYFLSILDIITKDKAVQNILVGAEMDDILPQDKKFYERLASDLLTPEPGEKLDCTICNMPVCPICLDKQDTPYKCFNCNSGFHDCCAAQFSAMKHIGFMHIFRCPTCGSMLKLDEDLVNEVVQDKEKLASALNEDIEKLEKDREERIERPLVPAPQDLTPIPNIKDFGADEPSNLIIIPEEDGDSAEIPLPQPTLDEIPQEIPEREFLFSAIPLDQPAFSAPPPPPQVVRRDFFGPAIKVTSETIQPENSKGSPYWASGHKDHNSQGDTQVGEPKITSVTQLKPPTSKAKLRFCKICGAPVKGQEMSCKSCGAPI